MKLIVTGGAGYIGGVMVEQLIGEGEEVVVFDNLSRGHRAAAHPDAVMHFASHSQVGESTEKPLLYLGDNEAAGRHLLEAMMKHGVKKFIFSSTAALFGHPIPYEVGLQRAGDSAALVAGSEKIKNELEWKPEYPELRDIIASAWKWHQVHPKGYQTGGAS